jgi:hypothetical protein
VSAHSRLSASGSSTWINCPGSVAAQDGIADKGSEFAQEGTNAHELAEWCLKTGLAAGDLVGEQVTEELGFIVTADMASFVQEYLDYVRSIPGDLMIEQRVDYSDWVAGGFGTSDAIIINDQSMTVVDLKFGQGIKVYAKENTQGILYALGAYALTKGIYDIQTIRVVIHQPRLDHVDEWDLSVEDLLSWGSFLQTKSEEALAPDAPRVAGEKQCQWCKAKPTCPALAAHTTKIIASDFVNCDPTPVNKLSLDQMSDALANKKLIISWLDAIENLAVDRLRNGESFPGFKLVAGRSSRDWIDESEAEAHMHLNLEVPVTALYTQKFITPAAAEKLLGKKKAGALQDYITKSEGKPAMVPESDKRQALGVTADDFDGIDE